MMKYSNGVETTIFQTLYLYFLRFGGIYVAYGLALIAKSMHDF